MFEKLRGKPSRREQLHGRILEIIADRMPEPSTAYEITSTLDPEKPGRYGTLYSTMCGLAYAGLVEVVEKPVMIAGEEHMSHGYVIPEAQELAE